MLENKIMAVTVNGDSIDDVVSLSVSPGIALDPVKDHLGTIHAWVNSATGAIEQKMTYTAYGETEIIQSSPALASLGMQRAFTGREYDVDTELQHNRARWYDPHTGRFLNEDPIRFDGGDFNLYRYVKSNSANYKDPSGKWPEWIDDGVCFITKRCDPSDFNSPDWEDTIGDVIDDIIDDWTTPSPSPSPSPEPAPSPGPSPEPEPSPGPGGGGLACVPENT